MRNSRSLISLITKSLLISVLLTAISLVGCAYSRVLTYPSLANQGILPLSTSNSAVGANMFLAHELERSSLLFQFFKGRGAPIAIEIIENGVTPPQILMYYPKTYEVYTAERQIEGLRTQWIIRGPYKIDRDDYRRLQRTNLAMNGEPLFQIYGKPYTFGYGPSGMGESSVAKLEPLVPEIRRNPTPVPTLIKLPETKPETQQSVHTDTVDSQHGDAHPAQNSSSHTEPKATPAPVKPKIPEVQKPKQKFVPLNSDQQAINMSKGFAERADNGDVIHTVSTAHESLDGIATWYTDLESNAEALAHANNMAVTDKLHEGMRIRVPLELVKRFKQMPKP